MPGVEPGPGLLRNPPSFIGAKYPNSTTSLTIFNIIKFEYLGTILRIN
jgi:hypothetical protein